MLFSKLTSLPEIKLLLALTVCLAAALLFSACNSVSPVSVQKGEPVSVHKGEPVIEKHVYDKDNRPTQEIGKHPSVEANTHWDFQIIPEITVERKEVKPNKQGLSATVMVKTVSIELKLPIEMWLPASAAERVIAHVID